MKIHLIIKEIFCCDEEKRLNLEKRLLYSPKTTLESLIKNNNIDINGYIASSF